MEKVIRKIRCKRCDFEWYPLSPDRVPKACPNCKSYNWNRDDVRRYTRRELEPVE